MNKRHEILALRIAFLGELMKQGPKTFCLCALLLGWLLPCNAQDVAAPRFFNLSIQQLSSTTNLTNPLLQSIPVGRNEENFLVDASLKYPIKLQGKLKIIGSLGFKRETLFGLYEPLEDEGEDMTLHSAKTSFIASYLMQNNSKINVRLGWSSRSSKFLSLHPWASNWSASMLYDKDNGTQRIGYGFIASYGRRLNVLPLFLWQKDLGRGFGLDLLLPSKALITKELNRSSQLFAGIKAQTAGYFVEGDQHPLGDLSANYRRISVQAIFGYEKMINKLVGFSCSAGVNLPFASGMYSFAGKWNRLHNFQDRVAPQFKAGVFFALDRNFR